MAKQQTRSPSIFSEKMSEILRTKMPLCGIVQRFQRAAFSAFSVQRSTFKEGTGFIAVFTDALLPMNSFRVDASNFSEPSSCRWTCLVVRFNSSAAN